MVSPPFYEPIYDITADAGIKVWGDDLRQLVCNSILATVNEMVDLSKVEPKDEVILEVESAGFPYLLADILNEILYLFDAKKFVPSVCEVLQLEPEGKYAKLLLKGEKYNPSKHGKKLLLKAATYHRLRMEKENNRYKAEIIFDI